MSMNEDEWRPFLGFPDKGRKLLKAIARKQDRVWFAAHKDEYRELWHAPMEALLRTLAERLGAEFPATQEAPPKVFRLYRDTRFGADKTPFKSHVAGTLRLSTEPDEGAMLYLHLGVEEDVAGAGRWMMSPAGLNAYRSAVADEETGPQLAKLANGLVRKGFELYSHESLKRVPKPYAPDHPRGDLLRRKGLSVGFPAWPKGLETTPRFPKWIVDRLLQAAPLIRSLDDAMTRA